MISWEEAEQFYILQIKIKERISMSKLINNKINLLSEIVKYEVNTWKRLICLSTKIEEPYYSNNKQSMLMHQSKKEKVSYKEGIRDAHNIMRSHQFRHLIPFRRTWFIKINGSKIWSSQIRINFALKALKFTARDSDHPTNINTIILMLRPQQVCREIK